VLKALIRTIKQCEKQCKSLCQQGFMKAMFKASKNVKDLNNLIQEVDSRMVDLHLRVSSSQLALAVATDNKMDEMMKRMNEMMGKLAAGAHGKEDPADMDPKFLADIAKQAGMEAGQAMQDELAGMSAKMMAKMDEIADAVKGKIACNKAPMLVQQRPYASLLLTLTPLSMLCPDSTPHSRGRKARQNGRRIAAST
jgi:hypothetical protein